MVKNAATAIAFEQNLEKGLQPKFNAELEEFRQMKIKETGDPNAKIYVWDWRYFANELKKTKYNVDAEQLRVYFPYERVLEGLFAIYQHIFDLKFERVEPPYKWIGDLQLYTVSDAKTGQPLGLFLPRHVSARRQIQSLPPIRHHRGKTFARRKYQRPVCALVCKFPAAPADKPSLMSP